MGLGLSVYWGPYILEELWFDTECLPGPLLEGKVSVVREDLRTPVLSTPPDGYGRPTGKGTLSRVEG